MKYEAEITYGNYKDFHTFTTQREFWNLIKDHLETGVTVRVQKIEERFCGIIK